MTFLSNWSCRPVICPWGPALFAFQTCSLPWRKYWKFQCIFSLHKQQSHLSACTCNSCERLKLRHVTFHHGLTPSPLESISTVTPPLGPHSHSSVDEPQTPHSALTSHHLTTHSRTVTAWNFPKFSPRHHARVIDPVLRDVTEAPAFTQRVDTVHQGVGRGTYGTFAATQ